MKKRNSLSILLGLVFSTIFVLVLLIYSYFVANDIEQVSVSFYFLSVIVILTTLYLMFVYYIGSPVQEIYSSVRSLVYSNIFSEINLLRKDEFAYIGEFINEIVKKIDDYSNQVQKGKKIMGEVLNAKVIQDNILPIRPPEGLIGIDLLVRTKASSSIGGDSFDFMKSGHNYYFYIGDVTGHGIPAAMIMTMANATIRSLVSNDFLPKEIFIKTNQLLFDKISTNHFMTSVMLRWDNSKQKMYYTGAGHETILIYKRKTGKVESVKSGGIALKIVKNIGKYLEEKPLNFKKGDTILLYTDGITEAQGKNSKRYTLDRLLHVFQRHAMQSNDSILNAITRDFSKFLGSCKPSDDASMILIKNIGEHGSHSNVDIGYSNLDKDSFMGQWNWG